MQSGPKRPGGQHSLSSSMHNHSNRSGASCCLWNHHVSTWSSICSSSWLHSKSDFSQAASTISRSRVSLRAYLASFSSSQAVFPPPKFLLAVLSKPLMKLSVSFRQVWHGAVWTLTTESSERSTRAGRKGQAHHMMIPYSTSAAPLRIV